MAQIDRSALKRLSGKYIRWKTPDKALPDYVIAQVVNSGDYVQRLVHQVGDVLRKLVADAHAGRFGQRSWAYWNYRLGLASVDHGPPAFAEICMTGVLKPRMGMVPLGDFAPNSVLTLN